MIQSRKKCSDIRFLATTNRMSLMGVTFLRMNKCKGIIVRIYIRTMYPNLKRKKLKPLSVSMVNHLLS